MKFKYHHILPLILFMACNKSDEPIAVDQYLISRKWQQTKAYISAGGPQYWIDVENGEEIEFFNNGTFTSDKFSDCLTGNFSIENNTLYLKYNCTGFHTEAENEDGFITYTIDFYSDYFILTPTSGPICTEGCSSKYESKE